MSSSSTRKNFHHNLQGGRDHWEKLNKRNRSRERNACLVKKKALDLGIEDEDRGKNGDPPQTHSKRETKRQGPQKDVLCHMGKRELRSVVDGKEKEAPRYNLPEE